MTDRPRTDHSQRGPHKDGGTKPNKFRDKDIDPARIAARDVLRAVLASPWHLVRGTVLALPSLLVAASVTVVVGGISWWLLDTRRLELTPPGNASWVYHAVLALATAAGLATLWSGPLARRTRLGARRTLERLAPGRTGAAVVIALCLVGIGVAAVLVATGEPTWWWPLPGPPSLA